MYKTKLKTSLLGPPGWITGFRRPGQVDPIVAAAGLELTDEDISEIEAAQER
jgi:aryl-alcohol dehydrogenase-like predicted oxidoreductase